MSQSSVTLLRGLGILLIITHNYMHWLPECVDENEYTFSVERINQLVLYIEQGGPHVILNILSHFGHYGVAIFLFLSGYGLTMKYEKFQDGVSRLTPYDKEVPVWKFLLRHAVKLWKLMLPVLLIFVAIELYLGTWNRPWSRLLPLMGFYSNMQTPRDLILGPWWWFGLMMQFYIIWRLIIYKRSKWVLYTTIALCMTVQIAVAWVERGNLASTDTVTCYLHYNFPSSMLAFGLGVAYARYNLEWLRQWWSPLVGMVIIIIGTFNAGIWCITPAGVVMVALAFEKKHEPLLTNHHIKYLNLRNGLIFLGTISAWLFALHPVVRAYTIKLAANNNDWEVYLSIIIYLAISIAAAWIVTETLQKKKKYSKTDNT